MVGDFSNCLPIVVIERNQFRKMNEINFRQATPADVEKIAEVEWQRHVSELAWKTVSQSLAPKVRQTFERFLAGKSATDIAKELQLEVNTVHVYKQRVRKKLMKEALRLDDQYG